MPLEAPRMVEAPANWAGWYICVARYGCP